MGREWHGWHDMNPCNGKSESASSQQCSGLEDLLPAAPRKEWREQTQLSHSFSPCLFPSPLILSLTLHLTPKEKALCGGPGLRHQPQG